MALPGFTLTLTQAEEAFAISQLRMHKTIPEAEAAILKLREMDATDAALKYAEEKLIRERMEKRAQMDREIRESDAKRPGPPENMYWKSPEPWSPIFSPPDPYGFGKPGGHQTVKGEAPASPFDNKKQPPYGEK